MAATLESGGENLLKGLENLLDDLERGKGELKVSMTDREAFEIGKNIATTPRKKKAALATRVAERLIHRAKFRGQLAFYRPAYRTLPLLGKVGKVCEGCWSSWARVIRVCSKAYKSPPLRTPLAGTSSSCDSRAAMSMETSRW